VVVMVMMMVVMAMMVVMMVVATVAMMMMGMVVVMRAVAVCQGRPFHPFGRRSARRLDGAQEGESVGDGAEQLAI
jgi:hypothetical protein